MATSQLMTADDLARMAPDANRYDLIRGVLYTMPPAGEEHGGIAYDIGFQIGLYVAAHQLGRMYAAETGFLVARNPDTVLAPDVAFIRTERLRPRHQMRGFAPVVPDLAVEVRSPSDRRGEVMTKVEAYLEAGVGALWLVDPVKRQVTIFRPGQPPQVVGRDEVLDGGDVLPGFRLALAEIFPD